MAGGAPRRLVTALMFMLLALLAPAATAQAADPSSPTIGGFSARALGPDGDVSPETYFKATLKPGDTYSGRILVVSSAKEDVRLRLYSVDGLTGETSGTVYANLDDPREGVATWITPRKELLRLPGKKQKTVGFDLKVPDDARPGDHVGGLALQLAEQPKAEGQFAVTEVIRVAIAVHITVEGPASAQLKPTGMVLKALPGTQMPSVTVDLENSGQLLCRPKLTIELAQDGNVLGSVERQLDTILPGKTIPYPMAWPRALPAGKYSAKTVTEGCGPRGELASDLELATALRGTQAQPGTSIKPAEESKGIPWWALALAVVAALGGGFLIARRKPKSKDDDDTGGAPGGAPA